MRIDRIIAIIGVLLGAVSVVTMLFTPYASASILALTLIAGVATLGVVVSRAFDRPLFRVDAEKRSISRQQGHWYVRRELSLRPNFPHLRSVVLRIPRRDGDLANFAWNDVPIPAEEINLVGNAYNITIKFASPRKRGELSVGTLEYVDRSADEANGELAVYVAEFPTRVAEIEVSGISRSGPSEPRVFMREGATELLLDSSSTTRPGPGRIRTLFKTPRVGVEYVIYSH